MTRLDKLTRLLQTIPDLELTVLVGSRAHGSATDQSDWDIAVRWEKHINSWTRLENSEILKQQIADAIEIHKDQIMVSARLAMQAVIAEEGIVLKGEDALAWSHYLIQTWGELEDYYWRKNHAA
ncbi:MAG: nucleotidyltransferase domain-containing protein [Burkholderiaceae bacterium]